jgi:hypothetical protein
MPDDDDILDPPPTEDELRSAEGLRRELETRPSSEEGHLATALRAAWEPRDLPAEAHRALVQGALRRKGGGTVVRITPGRMAMIALAASVSLVLWKGDAQAPRTAGTAAVGVSRSTESLFSEHFAATGGETARIDRIAMARAADLRENEFARWGVR